VPGGAATERTAAQPGQRCSAVDADMTDGKAGEGGETGAGCGGDGGAMHSGEAGGHPHEDDAIMVASEGDIVAEHEQQQQQGDLQLVGRDAAREWACRVRHAIAQRVVDAAQGGAAACARDVPERVRWAVLSFAEACDASKSGAVPQDDSASVEMALNILGDVARTRRHGLLLVCACLDAAITAVQLGATHVTCPLGGACRCPDGTNWQLSLLSTAAHVQGDAAEPLVPDLAAVETPDAMLHAGKPLFAVGPDLLGQYVQRGRCHRFIALKACRGFIVDRHAAAHGQEQVGDGESVEAALERVTYTGATMRKGLDWEKALNSAILDGRLDLNVLSPLYSGQPFQSASTTVTCTACTLVNLATLAFDQGCDCGLKHSGGQFDAFDRARRHRPGCGYQGKLEELSRAELFKAGAAGTCRLLYQATFDVNSDAGAYESVSRLANDPSMVKHQRIGSHMRRLPHGRVTIDSTQMAFSRLSPDYIALLFLPDGSTRVVVVDAKASAKVKVSHRIQVAFYTFILQRLVKQHAGAGSASGSAPNIQVARWGCVWRPSLDARRRSGALLPAIAVGPPDVFHVDDLMATVERELFVSLPAVLSRPSFETLAGGRPGQLCAGQSWHLQAACQGCPFISV
jgi:hypothetical protein